MKSGVLTAEMLEEAFKKLSNRADSLLDTLIAPPYIREYLAKTTEEFEREERLNRTSLGRELL